MVSDNILQETLKDLVCLLVHPVIIWNQNTWPRNTGTWCYWMGLEKGTCRCVFNSNVACKHQWNQDIPLHDRSHHHPCSLSRWLFPFISPPVTKKGKVSFESLVSIQRPMKRWTCLRFKWTPSLSQPFSLVRIFVACLCEPLAAKKSLQECRRVWGPTLENYQCLKPHSAAE